MSNGKGVIIHLRVGLIKKVLLYKMSHFPEPNHHNKNEIKVELELSNYVTKSDLKNPTVVDTSTFAKKIDLASLKSTADKLDIGKLETTLLI